MPWNEDAARDATRNAYPELILWMAKYPDAAADLIAIWKDAYLQCGHKRLAQMLLGRTPEQTDSRRRE